MLPQPANGNDLDASYASYFVHKIADDAFAVYFSRDVNTSPVPVALFEIRLKALEGESSNDAKRRAIQVRDAWQRSTSLNFQQGIKDDPLRDSPDAEERNVFYIVHPEDRNLIIARVTIQNNHNSYYLRAALTEVGRPYGMEVSAADVMRSIPVTCFYNLEDFKKAWISRPRGHSVYLDVCRETETPIVRMNMYFSGPSRPLAEDRNSATSETPRA